MARKPKTGTNDKGAAKANSANGNGNGNGVNGNGKGASGDLPALSVRRPYLAAVLNFLIILAGVSAIFGVEVRELPDIDRPIVTVRATYPGGSPETIDADITSKIEAAVARVNGVKHVRSSSEEDNLRVRAEFRATVDLIDAANDVREAVSRVENELPEGVEDIFVVKADADANPIIQLSAYSDRLNIDALTQLIEDEIIPELMSVDGVADIQLFGDRERVLRVVIDPMRLASHQLSVADVAEVLRSTRFDVPAGSFESESQEVLVRADASVIAPEEIENLIIRDPVRVGDVASVSYGPAESESYVRLNSRTVINMGVVRQAQSNTVSISRGVKRIVGQINARFDDVTIHTTSDDARFIEGAIREVLITLGMAVVIVVTVLALFVGQLRAAMIPAATIPVALTGTVAAVWLMGFSINLVTLLAMVLAAGLVVDDAIVVLENIQRLRGAGIASRAAAVLGTRQVFFAVLATTATLISVFLPISFLPSTAGRLFTEFGFVLAVTVCTSSFVALSLCPMLASRLRNVEAGSRNSSRRFAGAAAGSVRQGYAWLLERVLAAPMVLLGLCAIVIVSAGLVYQTLDEELVPEEDRGKITILMTGPDGTGIDYIDRQVEKAEDVLRPFLDDGTITDLFTISGRWDPNRAWIEAPLKDWSERDKSEGEIARALDKPIRDIPGAQSRIIRENSLGLRDAGGGLEIALTGSSYTRIAEVADKFVLAMERDIPQLRNHRVEFRDTQPQLSVQMNRRRASDLGVSVDSLATTLQVLVDKDEVAELTVDDQAVPIMLQATEGSVTDPTDLHRLYVSAADGRLVPLSQLVTFKEDAVAAELDRHGQRRAVEIDADPAPGFSLREAVDATKALADKELPPDINLLLLGEAAELEDTSHGIFVTYAVALLVVFLVLMAQFESLMSALIVLLTVPFGICAAVFALALTGTSINIYSQIGVLMLIGIMAKNSILMVEFADQMRERGHDVVESVREACMVRVRPIVMTMVSTIMAGLPLILGGGPGSESRGAIGWVVFGGLGLAGVFTLFLTPALYVLIAGWMKPRSAETEQLAQELSEAESIHVPSEHEKAQA